MGKSQFGALALSTRLCRAGSWVSFSENGMGDVLLRSIQYGYTGIQHMGQRIVTVISELAAFVAGAKASALPAAQRERLRLHLTDTVVAAVAGARIPEGQALRSPGGNYDVVSQIGRQAAAARLTEIDDIHLASCT